jgi:uncharacterized protein
MFHRMPLPLESVRHFDLLHPARRLWRVRDGAAEGDGCCRLGTLERVLCDVTRVGDVPGLEIPGRYFQFLRTGDARPLEPVLEHNRLDLISLAAVAAHAVELVEQGSARCRDAAEAVSLGKVYERAGCVDRAMESYERAADDASAHIDVVAEALYRMGLRCRRDRRYADAAAIWRRILDLKPGRLRRNSYGGQVSQRSTLLGPLRQFAVEALAIHHEHRERDYEGARELTLQLLEEDGPAARTDARRHRLARLERKLARNDDSHLFA